MKTIPEKTSTKGNAMKQQLEADAKAICVDVMELLQVNLDRYKDHQDGGVWYVVDLGDAMYYKPEVGRDSRGVVVILPTPTTPVSCPLDAYRFGPKAAKAVAGDIPGAQAVSLRRAVYRALVETQEAIDHLNEIRQ
ncbi:uncharacterized protein METZ01_LOCUS444287 [marine metagenome]|uniref:Uncharacterized protein n=1 Tax=marine metagenome TaxID=408172 RepID=A0A382Z7K6_9ZZZZ